MAEEERTDEPMRLGDVVAGITEAGSSNWDRWMSQRNTARQGAERYFWNPVQETLGDLTSNIWSDVQGWFRNTGAEQDRRSTQQQRQKDQREVVAGPEARALQTESGTEMLRRRSGIVNYAELQNDVARVFTEEYERSVQMRQERQYSGVPLGFVEGQYTALQQPDGSVTYQLNEWPRSPMEEAARRTASESPERQRQMLAVGGAYARAFSTPAGIQQLERRTMGSDYRTPFLTEDTVETDETAVLKVARMDLEQLNTLKNRLIQLDLLDPDDAGIFEYADRTPQTYDAFLTLVSKAQENGKNWVSFLDDALANNVSFGRAKKRQPAAAQLIRLSSRDDLASVFNATAQRTVGRRLTEQEQQFLIDSYHQMERTFYRQAASGGDVEMVAAPETFGEEQLQQMQPEQYDVVGVGRQLENFRAIVLGQA
jgi:hypothetical protein